MALALLTNAVLGAVLQKLFQSEPKAETCSYRSGLPPELHLLLEDAERGWKGAWEQGKAGPVQPWEQPEPCSPQDVPECHRDSASRHHFFPSESVLEFLLTHSKFSHQSVLYCPLHQEGVAGSELPVWVALLLYQNYFWSSYRTF